MRSPYVPTATGSAPSESSATKDSMTYPRLSSSAVAAFTANHAGWLGPSGGTTQKESLFPPKPKESPFPPPRGSQSIWNIGKEPPPKKEDDYVYGEDEVEDEVESPADHLAYQLKRGTPQLRVSLRHFFWRGCGEKKDRRRFTVSICWSI